MSGWWQGVGIVRVLVACEYSGRVRDAFAAKGHAAVSCDLLQTETPGTHIQGDVLNWIDPEDGKIWDMMVAFPPCTDIAVSGAKWFAEKRKSGQQRKAIEFFLELANSGIPKIAIENPIGIMSGKRISSGAFPGSV
jgi:hypothetical protein